MNAGLVARRKEGLQVFYRLEDPVVEKVCHLVCETICEVGRAASKVGEDLAEAKEATVFEVQAQGPD